MPITRHRPGGGTEVEQADYVSDTTAGDLADDAHRIGTLWDAGFTNIRVSEAADPGTDGNSRDDYDDWRG